MKRLTSFGIGVAALLAGSAIIGATVATNPAAADEARSLTRFFGFTMCNSSNPCVEVKNNGIGPAIRADGTRGEGVVAISYSSIGVRGFTRNQSNTTHLSTAGLAGVDQSTDGGTLNDGVFGFAGNGTGVAGSAAGGSGVAGSSTTGTGVSGSSTGGTGVSGSSSSGSGVQGTTNCVRSQCINGIAGVSGTAPSTSDGIGVIGQSFNGSDAVDGIAWQGGSTGVAATAPNGGVGIFAQAGGAPIQSIAVRAYNVGGVNNIGVYTSSDGTSLFAQNVNQSAGPAALVQGGTNDPSTNSLVTEDGSGSPTFWVDNGGNAHVRGLLFTSGPCSAGCLKPNGSPARLVQRYTPQEAVPTIEDVGEAQLLGGSAYVRIDSAFANVMDQNATYLVFVTPQGLTRGLYVTNKTAQGFQVKEEPGGSASVAFDYRIVAKPLGQSAPRLPMVATPLVPKAPPPPKAPHSMKIRPSIHP